MNGNRENGTVRLEHGSGGFLSRELVERVIYPAIRGSEYPELSDATRFELDGPGYLTTDTFTVDPPFFPGGDIGKLAVFGTCNDLSVAGARPRYLSMGLVIEEGFPIADLERILQSVAGAAGQAPVAVAPVAADLRAAAAHHLVDAAGGHRAAVPDPQPQPWGAGLRVPCAVAQVAVKRAGAVVAEPHAALLGRNVQGGGQANRFVFLVPRSLCRVVKAKRPSFHNGRPQKSRCSPRQFRAIFNTELGQQGRNVELYGSYRDVQLHGNFLVRMIAHYGMKDLPLSGA